MNIDALKGKTVGAAVSGGLDSCTITKWLVDNGVKVVCFTADLGQPDERDVSEIQERMLACGAKKKEQDRRNSLIFLEIVSTIRGWSRRNTWKLSHTLRFSN